MNRVLRHPFVRGTVLLTGANILVSLLNYVFNSQAGKILGPAGYGDVAALFSYLTLTSIPLSIVTALLIRRLGAAGQSRLAYARSVELWFYKRMKRWWWLFFAPIATIPALPFITNLSPVAAIALGVLIPLTILGAFYSATVQGLQLFATAAAVAVSVTLVKFLGIPVAYAVTFQLSVILLFYTLSTVVSLWANWYFVHKKTKLVHPVLVKPITKRFSTIVFSRQSLIAMGALSGLMLFGTADVIAAKRFLTPDIAGYFSAWSLLSKIPLYAAGPVIAVLYILFGDVTRKKLHLPALVGMVVITIVGGLFSVWFYTQYGAFLIQTVFSSAFMPILNYLPRAAFFGTLLVLISVLTQFFVGTHAKAALVTLFCALGYLISLLVWGKTLDAIVYVDVLWGSIVVGALLATLAFQKRSSFLLRRGI